MRPMLLALVLSACGSSERGTAPTPSDGGDGAPQQATVTIIVTEYPPPDAGAD